MRSSESGRISMFSTRRPPTAAAISCTFGAPTAKKKTSILPDLKSSEARMTLTVGTPFTSFSVTPPAASRALRCVMTLVCCTHSDGMFLPLRSAMLCTGESLRTQKAIWKPNSVSAARRLGLGLPFQTFSPFCASAGSPTSSSRKSACLELTASRMPVSPPWPMTRTCSLEWSCTTFAITEACALSSVPGWSVAKPTVCCALAVVAKTASSPHRDFSILISSLLRGQYSNPHAAAQGPGSLFRHRRPTEARASRRRARRGVDHRQRRGMVDRARDAAHRASSSVRSAPSSRSAQLGVARVRNAGGLLAVSRCLEQVQHQGDAGDQWLGHQVLSARGGSGAEGGLGIHGARLHPAADASRREPARGDRRHDPRDSRLHRQ